MAMVAQSEDYDLPLPCYGSSGQQTPEVGGGLGIELPADMNAAPSSQGLWDHQQAESAQFWQGEPVSEADYFGPGGMSPMPYGGGGNGGWVSGPGMNMPPRPVRPPSGNGSASHQPTRLKRRFCTSFPDVQLCRRGTTCAFAHSREEIRAPLLAMEEEQQEQAAMTDDFFMFKYKTMWCPIGVQHEWHTCVYAHNYQDARRPVNIGYGARLCPYWSKKDTGAEYSQRCPLGLRCPYAHGAKEQLYHPQYFKTVVCRDLRGKACPRHGLCAFFHNRTERRIANPQEEIDYSQPLPEQALHSDWIMEFLTPPFLPESTKGEDGMPLEACNPNMANGNMGMTSYAGAQAAHSPYGMQQQFVFMVPYSPQMSPQMAPMGHGPMGPMCGPNGSPMASPMNGQQNWVFVPMDGSQQA